jgi:hypothetical protein
MSGAHAPPLLTAAQPAHGHHGFTGKPGCVAGRHIWRTPDGSRLIGHTREDKAATIHVRKRLPRMAAAVLGGLNETGMHLIHAANQL